MIKEIPTCTLTKALKTILVASLGTLVISTSLFFASNAQAEDTHTPIADAVEELPVTVGESETAAEELLEEEHTSVARASDDNHAEDESHAGGHGSVGTTLLIIAVLLLAAKLGGSVEQFGVPRVLGELTAGVVLSLIAYFFGLDFLAEARASEIIVFLAEFGVILLLFEIGLESNVKQLIKVGPNSLLVALIGAAAPFAVGTLLLGPWLFPEASTNAYLFIGATLVATSVGISASIFQNLKKTKTRAFQTFLGATLTDDVLGLITLAIVSSIATGGDVTLMSVVAIISKAVAFLGGAVVLGTVCAPYISKFFSLIHTGTGMKLGLALVAAIFFAYLATLVGLAPIIGAFAAGLILDAVHFDSFENPVIVAKLEKLKKAKLKEVNKAKLDKIIHHAKHTHIEDMVRSLSLIFVPIFFTFTGLQLEAEALMNPNVYFVAIIITVIAVAAKVIGGFAAQGSIQEKLLVGFAMAPRGEVGLIFATMGRTLGVFDAELFSAMVMVTFLTTFAAIPPIKILAAKVKVAKSKKAPVLRDETKVAALA